MHVSEWWCLEMDKKLNIKLTRAKYKFATKFGGQGECFKCLVVGDASKGLEDACSMGRELNIKMKWRYIKFAINEKPNATNVWLKGCIL